jgi:hypothetical protein
MRRLARSTTLRRLLTRRWMRTALATAAMVTAGLPASAAAAGLAGAVSGTVTYVGATSFTIMTAGRQIGVIDALTVAANRLTHRDYPYVYGGGHGRAGVASVGLRGPGYNGHKIGFDCSGAVAAVLAGGGLWTAGSGVPSDAGIVATLLAERVIAPGVGRGTVQVTVYDRRGVHIFMNIDGRFFGTSDGAGGGDPRGGAGWLDDGAPDAGRRAYRAYHLLPSVLRGSASSGHIVSFQTGALQGGTDGLQAGEPVRVSYTEARTGALVASAITFPGALTVSGVVAAVASDGSSFTLQTPTGTELSFDTSSDPSLTSEVAVGDAVQVTYTTSHGVAVAHIVDVTSVAPAGVPAGGSPAGLVSSSSGGG